MCNCEKEGTENCNDCSPSSKYNTYQTESCGSCGDKEVKCKKTIAAKCVINNEDLDFLGIKGKDKIDMQVILQSITNALESLSSYECMEYIRKVNADTGIATYKHSLNFECIASIVCDICEESVEP